MTAGRLGRLLTACGVIAAALAAQVRPIVHEPDGSIMVVVLAGEFTMGTDAAHPDLPATPPGGEPLHPQQVLTARADAAWRCADERPAHRVRMPAFAIDRYEVTNAQYRRFVAWLAEHGDHSHCHQDEPPDKDHRPRYWRDFNPLLSDPAYAVTTPFSRDTFTAADKPVVGVDWFDAYAYAAWAHKRLPTEAEWEYAARGTDGRLWPWGSQWSWQCANTGGEKHGIDVPGGEREKDGYIYAAPVGSFPAGRSPFGCDDMAGNVAEWCADWYATDTCRAVRGGSSRNLPSSVRCAARSAREPLFRTFTLGFRCAKDL